MNQPSEDNKQKFKSNTLVYETKPLDFCPKVEIAAIYVDVQGKILLLELAAHKLEAGAWGVPAGKLEANESALSGAKRELFEETGILASDSALLSIGRLYIRKPEVDYVYHMFSLKGNDALSICLSDEHKNFKWATQEEAHKLPLMQGAEEALDFYYRSV